MADLNFNANEVEPSNDFEPIPAGKYLAVITDSEMKPTKAGNGQFLQLAFQVIEGEFANRMLWARLNLDNPNATAVQIARSDLSAICRAVDVLIPRDSSDLHNLPLEIHVRLKRRGDSGELQNEIKGYTAEKSGHTPQQVATSATSNGQPAAKQPAAPWKR